MSKQQVLNSLSRLDKLLSSEDKELYGGYRRVGAGAIAGARLAGARVMTGMGGAVVVGGLNKAQLYRVLNAKVNAPTFAEWIGQVRRDQGLQYSVKDYLEDPAFSTAYYNNELLPRVKAALTPEEEAFYLQYRADQRAASEARKAAIRSNTYIPYSGKVPSSLLQIAQNYPDLLRARKPRARKPRAKKTTELSQAQIAAMPGAIALVGQYTGRIKKPRMN